MDKVIEQFIINNNMNLKQMRLLPEWNLHNIKDKNILAHEYGIYQDTKIINISVADIVGYDYKNHGGSRDLIQNMKHFFCDNGDSYHTRANGMLEYNSENIIDKLNYSFTREPIHLNEVDNNYFISINGFHRFHVLRLFYLNELLNTSNIESLHILKEKYTIITKANSIDYIKTYCRFLLANLYPTCLLSSEYDLNFNKTGKSVLKIDNETLVLTDEELIQFTTHQLMKKEFRNKNLKQFNFLFQEHYAHILSFQNFIDNYFQGIELERKAKRSLLKLIKKRTI